MMKYLKEFLMHCCSSVLKLEKPAFSKKKKLLDAFAHLENFKSK